MKDNFVHLHVHSTYSFTDGVGLPEQYIDRAKELNQPGLAVTDHGNISAHYKWYKKCKKAEIVPILGCELYIVEDIKELKEETIVT
jgi:DNA polymerase III, alpha subunit (EC 2.7.7.7)